MFRRSVVLLVTSLALSCATAAPDDAAALRDRYTGEAGTLPVGAIPDVTLRDEERAKDVALTIEYPIHEGTYPLIVLSHRFAASNRSYVGLSAFWTSHGYVVVKPAHADANDTTAETLADAWRGQTAADWANRVRDISFVLDSIGTLEEHYPELKGKIDRSRVGVAGHAYGAHTAMLIGGVRTFPGGTVHADPRVKAVIAMSPQGPGEVRGLTAESFADLRVPALFMTGTLDAGMSEGETPAWRRQAFDLAAEGDKWLAVLEGASHGSFTGQLDDVLEERVAEQQRNGMPPVLPRRGEIQTVNPQESRVVIRERQIFAAIKGLSLAFWDAYLKGEADARAALAAARRDVHIEQR